MNIPHVSGPFETLRKLCAGMEYDCIVVRTNRYMRQLSPLLKQTNKPVIYFRNYLRWHEGNGTTFDPELERLGFEMADHVFFSGPTLKSPVEKMKFPIPGGEILHNALDFDQHTLMPKTTPPAPPFKIGMLGNINPVKNYTAAIEALYQDLRAHKVHLTIAGAFHYPDYGRELKLKAEGLPISFISYINDVSAFLAAQDVFLSTSKHEGWPNSIMEAFANGLPAIAPDVGDIMDTFGPNQPGFIYPAGEYGYIPRLIEKTCKPNHYVKLSRAAVERAKKFNIEVAVDKLSQTINMLIQQKNND